MNNFTGSIEKIKSDKKKAEIITSSYIILSHFHKDCVFKLKNDWFMF